MARSRSFTLFPAALLLLAACAAGAVSRSTNYAEIVVANDLIPRSSLMVRVVSSAGTRTLLGSVSPGQRTAFGFRESSFSGQYRLVAEATDGRQITSTGFALFTGARVLWQADRNLVTVEQ